MVAAGGVNAMLIADDLPELEWDHGKLLGTAFEMPKKPTQYMLWLACCVQILLSVQQTSPQKAAIQP